MSQFESKNWPRSNAKRAEENARQKKGTAKFMAGGRESAEEQGYVNLDSPLTAEYENNFEDSFKDVLPKGEKYLREYLMDLFKEKTEGIVAIEYGGIAERLFRGLPQEYIKKTLGVTLVDESDDEKKENRKKYQDEHPDLKPHTIMENTDIFSDETYPKINKWLDGDKVDLIFERMLKGVEYVPEEAYKVAETIQLWYQMLAEGGVMFVQVPVVFNNLFTVWAEEIKKEYAGLIDLQYTEGFLNVVGITAFRLRKLPGAPEKLPFLSAKEVRSIPKYDYRSKY